MCVRNNWTLPHAADTARDLHMAPTVCFVLTPSFLGATPRAYDFLLQRLQEVETDLHSLFEKAGSSLLLSIWHRVV